MHESKSNGLTRSKGRLLAVVEVGGVGSVDGPVAQLSAESWFTSAKGGREVAF